MTQRLLRRDKDDKSRIETRLYGPFEDDMDDASAPAQKLKFTDTKVTEVDEGGDVIARIRSIASVQLEPGKRYLLSWTMLGSVGAEVDFLLDQQDNPAGATFKSIAKDKLPAGGSGFTQSRQTNAGFLWTNAKRLKG